MKKSPPDEFAAEKISFLLDLPPADQSLIFCARGGRRIRVDRSHVNTLTLTLDGAWTEPEKARISDLLASQASSLPDVCNLRDAADPLRGLVFPDGNQFAASAAVHSIVSEVLGVNPARLPVEKNYDDHDARPEIARRLRKDYSVEISHEESGVRVWARIWGKEYYSLSVPVACLDASRGQRGRAEDFIADAGWRAYDGDLGPEPTVGEDDEFWGYSRDHGGAQAAADQALRLLCEIVDLPINTRVSLREPLAPRFWISVAIYALGAIVLSTVGIMMISGYLPP